jgi:hypothetical protein
MYRERSVSDVPGPNSEKNRPRIRFVSDHTDQHRRTPTRESLSERVLLNFGPPATNGDHRRTELSRPRSRVRSHLAYASCERRGDSDIATRGPIAPPVRLTVHAWSEQDHDTDRCLTRQELEVCTGVCTGRRFPLTSRDLNGLVEPNPHGCLARNGRCRTRTCGHLRVRQALYQLS